MQRLLIVDDEVIISDGLYEIFSREADLNLDIYKCYSAQEAIQLIEQHRFDILLTDIQMPGTNGLQLAEKMRQKWPKCRIVFLTGHHDFDYVYTAISYERVNYILKTEGYDKVIEAVKYAIADTIKSNELDQYIEEQQLQQKHDIKQLFLNELVYGEISELDINEETFRRLELQLSANESVLVLMAQHTLLNKYVAFPERVRLKYELKWIAENFFSDFPLQMEVLIKDNYLVWLLQPTAQSDWPLLTYTIHNHLDTLQDTFNKQCSVDISFVLDKAEIGWSELPKRIEQLNVLFQYRYGSTDHQIILSANMMNAEQKQLLQKTSISMSQVALLEQLLQQSQQLEFEQQLDIVLKQLLHVEQESISEEIYLRVAMIYFSFINKWSIHHEVERSISLDKLLLYHQHFTKVEAATYLKLLGRCLVSLQHEVQDKRASSVIENLKHYIIENIYFPDKLTLVNLSEISFFNTSYLSRLFKQVTGKNVSDFILEIRMERAKELLIDPHHKIQDVAEKLGYSNATNFTRVFKKQFGMTPQDYRFSLTSSK